MESICFILLSTSWGQSFAVILAIVGAFWVVINWPKWTVGDKNQDGTWRTESEKENEILNRASKPGLIGTLLILVFSLMFFIYILSKVFGVE